jgi:transposase
VDANGMPVRAIITNGATADCSKAAELTDGIAAKYLLADKGYDSDEIVNSAKNNGIEPVIPPRSNRKILSMFTFLKCLRSTLTAVVVFCKM